MEIRVEDLHKSFNENYVLRGIDFAAKSGEITVIIGGSGAGKSVLLKHLIGLVQPDRGRIFVGDVWLGGLSERQMIALRRRFGMIFQTGGLLNSLRVWENVALPLVEHGWASHKEIEETVHRCLAQVGMADKGDEMPANLSGGMRKRVSIARALTTRPETMLFDEPTAGLDPPRAQQIDDLIKRVSREFRVTSVVVTHDMLSAFQLADHIHMLHEGRFVASGTAEQIRASTDPHVRSFISRHLAGT